MNRRRPLLLLSLASVGFTGIGRAQIAVQAPGGTLTGVVLDSAAGTPIGYALVILIEHDQRVFSSESGRFTLTGLGTGRTLLRVQQIGYRARTLTLTVDTRGSPSGSPGLVVRLARQAFVLPEIVVQGNLCAGAGGTATDESGSILDEAFKNAERLLTLERSYPYASALQRLKTEFDTLAQRLGGLVDTVRFDSRRAAPYRKGHVLEWVGRGMTRRQDAVYFSASDVARDEFRRSHCFWYSGRDSVEGFPGYRIEFAPTAATRTPDWAGSLLIDSASMVLLSSEARLVNLPSTGTTWRAGSCRMLYKQLAPTLVHEFHAQCVHQHTAPQSRYIVERYLLIDFKFLKATPGDTARPGGRD